MSKKMSLKNKKTAVKNNNLLIGAAIAGAALIVVVIFILMQKNGSQGLAKEISVAEAYQIYQKGDAFFVDVREQSEWDEYHAPGTTLIPLGELPNRLTELPKDRDIVVVCRSGNRSQSGRDILLQAGFKNVTSMAGGLKQWQSAGYPIEP